MIQSGGGPPFARSLLSNGNWARAGARMVTAITEAGEENSWNRRDDCPIPLPLGMPLVRNLGSGLWEIRSALPTESRARYFLCMKEKLFFCTDSSRKPEKLQRKTVHWLCSEKMRTSKSVKTRNKHRGGSFREFLRQDGMLEEVQAMALKRAVALKCMT